MLAIINVFIVLNFIRNIFAILVLLPLLFGKCLESLNYGQVLFFEAKGLLQPLIH